MRKLTIDDVASRGWLLFEVITGSKAYGLDTATSDTDIRGVFYLPKTEFYSLDYTPQVSNETNDIVYYELRRFVELLARNNPNILEMLNVPAACVLKKDPLMDRFEPGLFLSKLCEKTFANYALTQIKKASGLEKKIVNPQDGIRKSVLDFCYVYEQDKSLPVKEFLNRQGFDARNIGLVSLPHFRDCYTMYHSVNLPYSGIVRGDDSNEVALSSVPVGERSVGLLHFNRDGYSVHCKKYAEYRQWLERRNEARYATTVAHGKKYDSKNMMHVFRLLLMAKEIALEQEINVVRPDREFLLDIKQGRFEYEDLVQKAEALKDELAGLYHNSGLPEMPDDEAINRLLIELRDELYERE